MHTLLFIIAFPALCLCFSCAEIRKNESKSNTYPNTTALFSETIPAEKMGKLQYWDTNLYAYLEWKGLKKKYDRILKLYDSCGAYRSSSWFSALRDVTTGFNPYDIPQIKNEQDILNPKRWMSQGNSPFTWSSPELSAAYFPLTVRGQILYVIPDTSYQDGYYYSAYVRVIEKMRGNLSQNILIVRHRSYWNGYISEGSHGEIYPHRCEEWVFFLSKELYEYQYVFPTSFASHGRELRFDTRSIEKRAYNYVASSKSVKLTKDPYSREFVNKVREICHKLNSE